MRLDILDYSIYGNPCDADSDQLLCQAARALGLEVNLISLGRQVPTPPPATAAERVWLRYDLRSMAELRRVVDVAESLSRSGSRVFPPPRSILLSEDKWETHGVLAAAGVPTVASRPVAAAADRDGPLVVKPRVGWGGMNMAVADDASRFRLPPGESPDHYLVQPFVAHDRTWTVAVAGGREIGTIEKRAGGGDFRTNEACGGSARPAASPEGGVELVVAALDAVGLVTGTADLLELDDGIAVLEVNSAPGLEYPSIPDLDLAGPMLTCVMTWMDECDEDSSLHTV